MFGDCINEGFSIMVYMRSGLECSLILLIASRTSHLSMHQKILSKIMHKLTS